jgi:hypothetical protein
MMAPFYIDFAGLLMQHIIPDEKKPLKISCKKRHESLQQEEHTPVYKPAAHPLQHGH